MSTDGSDDLFAWAEKARANDPETSKQAAEEIGVDLNALERQFLTALGILGRATSNEVAAWIAGDNYGRRNTLRRRASDLIAKGSIVAIDPRVCRVTGKRATVYELRTGSTSASSTSL